MSALCVKQYAKKKRAKEKGEMPQDAPLRDPITTRARAATTGKFAHASLTQVNAVAVSGMFQSLLKCAANAKRSGHMAKEDSQLGLAEMVQRMQAPFTVNGTAGAPVERLLEIQVSLLKEAEVFASHWFERRNEAIETAIEAIHRMNSTGAADPADALRAIADWQRGSLERMSADAEEWTTLCMRGAAAASTVQVDAATRDADRAKADKANGKARTKPKAGHATPV